MPILKPYYRIWRGKEGYPYILDERYAKDRVSLCRAYRIILQDLSNLFNFIEPTDDNLNTYSHKTYELFLRICTEFESNCKLILQSNGYVVERGNIKDYYLINKAMHLSEYSLIIPMWKSTVATEL